MGGPCQFAEYEVPFAARSKRALYYGRRNKCQAGSISRRESPSHLNINITMNQNSKIGIVFVSHERFTQTTYEYGLRRYRYQPSWVVLSMTNHIPLNPTPSLSLDVLEPSVIIPSLPSQADDLVALATINAILFVSSHIS